ncbi:MAG: hypothetical protein COA96_02485 [SAR86 cluster bacterium]|uniref:GspL cytoplasmic actin-ATPase-like domain-containing protein n=1 Tax=SAR86 cluster bacterium TaxID=2030880 RepID=A0A2A5B837_9GAMM|nr:MAG: hypothetical protein COA96_02485 [SAR86 cluster bacterium]
MSSLAINNSQWRAQLLSSLPVAVRTLIQGASGRDLIKNISITLLVHDGHLLHIESERSVKLSGDDVQSLAIASRSVINEEQRENPVLLLLPPGEFVTTTIQMPGIAKENLAAALQIQSETVLPSFEETLALAINPKSADHNTEHTALWITQNRLSELFSAFADQGLFLAAIKPRLLNISSNNTNEIGISNIIDSDANTVTYAVLDNGVLQKWLHINKSDLEQEVFSEQWEKAIASDKVNTNNLELSIEKDYFGLTGKNFNQEYCFFPRGALLAKRRNETGKRYIVAAVVVAAMLFIGAMPFIAQSLEFRSLAATLESQRQMASTAREDQSVVVSFENEWGLINDFPQQRIRDAMFTLQNILSPDVLSSLEVSEGLIKIQGTSTEPQAILQRLEQDPMFTEVIFSRATNNSRYYIDLRLSTVNFDAYMVRHFPDE